jgi:hypothetical protein
MYLTLYTYAKSVLDATVFAKEGSFDRKSRLPGFVSNEIILNEFRSNDILPSILEFESPCESFCRNHICSFVGPTCQQYGPNLPQCRRATQTCLNCYNGCY